MAFIKCKMCGGDLVLADGSTIATCEYCGTTQTVPLGDSEKKLIQFERAERLRKNCEFDKAAGVYESIVAEFRQEAEAYWGLVLCKYGIEYVDDPATGKKVPTCHRSSFESILEDSNFEQTLENADVASRKVYREEAKQIEEIRKGIIAVSSTEDPYDIFICYKETADNGERTLDSVLAQDIYDALTAKGYRVFFSRISLEDKLGQAYEPFIFAALNSAKVMLAIGTDYEYYNAVWVKNEWSRYLKLMEKNAAKHLIPCFKGIDAYDMPKEFAKLQAQDLGKVGAMQDLLRGIDKLIAPQVKEKVTVESSGIVAETLARAYGFLNAKDWKNAGFTLDTVRGYEPNNVSMLIGKLMLDVRAPREADLAKCTSRLDKNPHYQQALKFADAQVKKQLEGYNKMVIYNMAVALSKQKSASALAEAIKAFQEIPGWKDAEEQAEKLQAELKKVKGKNKKVGLIVVAALVVIALVAGFFVLKTNYLDPLAIYNEAVALMESGDYLGAEAKFQELESFQDNNAKALECRYLYGHKLLENDQYMNAKAVFTELGDYSDSAECVNLCQYRYAESLIAKQQYLEAREALWEMQTYADTPDRIKECYYKEAEQLLAEGNYLQAEKWFHNAAGYLDAEKRVEEARREGIYVDAVVHMEKNELRFYSYAADNFKKILNYKDSRELYTTCKLKLAEDFFTKADYTNLMPILRDVIAAEYPAATAKANDYCAQMYTMAEDHLSNNRYQSALNLMTELSVLDYSDSTSRKTQLENQIAEDEKKIEGTWYSSNAWFSGAWLYVKDGRWAWTAFKKDLADYKSGKYQGSSYTYDPDTQTYTFRVTKHANGEKDYLTARISNGKLIIKSTDKDEAFYPGTYRRT